MEVRLHQEKLLLILLSSFTVTTIKIHKTDDDSNDNSVQFNALLNNGGSLQVNYNNGAVTWYNVTSGTLSSDVYTFTVSYATTTGSSAGTGLGEICVLGGASGTSGSSGSSGTSGSSGSSGTSGSSGSSGTSGSSGSSGTSGLGGTPSCVNQELEAITLGTAPGDYKFKVNTNTWSSIQKIWADFDAVVNGLDIPLGYYNSFQNMQGFQASLIITEIGGTDYATYAVGSFSEQGNSYFEIKMTYVNGSGSPTIGEDYCFAFQQAI